MGKRGVHVIVVSKRVTWLLLVICSLSMIGLVFALSGRAYASDDHPVRDLIGSGQIPARNTLLAFLMPVFANMLLFVPWGFLVFMALDHPSRARRVTYALAATAALIFAAAIHLLQLLLPMRVVTSAYDAAFNAAGATAGAALAQLRRDVRMSFEI